MSSFAPNVIALHVDLFEFRLGEEICTALATPAADCSLPFSKLRSFTYYSLLNTISHDSKRVQHAARPSLAISELDYNN